ncbi:MAG: PD40 domain-containing protein [Saprospiraceae bacterium]|nr:PD40 domain-containing protein [Saprospiraceae bacterium]
MHPTTYTLFLSLFPILTSFGQQSSIHKLSLLSQPVPTDSALIFGPEIISTADFEFAITFDPDIDELFFTRRKPDADNEIFTMQMVNGKWNEPTPVFFKANEGWDFEPHIDPSGNRLYFGSTRPLPDTSSGRGLRQWYCERKDDIWSSPTPLEKPFLDRSVIMYLTAAENGNLYFTTGEKGDKPEDWVIYWATPDNDHYGEIIRMDSAINGQGTWIAHSYIAPDESYLLYDFKSESGYGKSDIYISFRQNGTWTKPYNLGAKVNTPQTEMCASVSPDGQFLFFHRGGANEDEGNIYWIAFEPLREEVLSTIESKD